MDNERLHQIVNNLPTAEKYWCRKTGTQKVLAVFEGKEIEIIGPVEYDHAGERLRASQHFVSQLEDGKIVDLCRDHGERIFENLEDYLTNSGINFLADK